MNSNHFDPILQIVEASGANVGIFFLVETIVHRTIDSAGEGREEQLQRTVG
jgi:hypothetical protein